MTYKESSRLFWSFKAAIFAFRKAYPYAGIFLMHYGRIRTVRTDAGMYKQDNDALFTIPR